MGVDCQLVTETPKITAQSYSDLCIVKSPVCQHVLSSVHSVLAAHPVCRCVPAAFGFCEFGNPDAALRAIRLLHDLDVSDKKLVAKVDSKTQEVLEKYKVSC